ncbi:GDSL esterase/lipase EXL3 [Linum perenne]
MEFIAGSRNNNRMACIWSSGNLMSWVLLAIMAAAALGFSCADSEIPAIFVFGDSILDTGNNNYITTWSKCNFSPYGRNFLGAKPTGRFSDGKIISDLLVESLGIKDLLPPYLDPNNGVNDLLTGVAFASGDLVTQASEYIDDLYKLGARKIGVFSTLVSGCVPEARTLAGGKQRECAENFNELAKLYNGKLTHEIDYLGNKLPDVKIVFVDLFTPLLDIINNPPKYGFVVEKDGCCDTGKIEAAILCNEVLSPLTCTNSSEYIFWDSVHPTEKANKILVSHIREYIDKLLL